MTTGAYQYAETVAAPPMFFSTDDLVFTDEELWSVGIHREFPVLDMAPFEDDLSNETGHR